MKAKRPNEDDPILDPVDHELIDAAARSRGLMVGKQSTDSPDEEARKRIARKRLQIQLIERRMCGESEW